MGTYLCCADEKVSNKTKLNNAKTPAKPEVKIKLEDIFHILIESKNKKISMNDF